LKQRLPKMQDENISDSFCLSIAIPIYNEGSTIPELLQRRLAVLDRIPGGPHELLFVDHGSCDRTLQIPEQAVHADSRISVIALSRNFGHQAALSAALDHAVGDAVVLMDGDLQDSPEDIPALVKRHQEGYDVVYATRATRQEGWLVKLNYFLFYRWQAMLSDTRLPLDADFGLMSRRVVDQIRRVPERQRYLRGLRSRVGFRQVAIPLHRSQRHSGQSKYGFLELLKLASDGIFAFSVLPLRATTLMGGLAVAVSALYALYSVYAKFVLNQALRVHRLGIHAHLPIRVLLFFLGIIGEYVGGLYEEIKARPFVRHRSDLGRRSVE
jgi:polyisoprenyl-phosphate glycosyltransferase